MKKLTTLILFLCYLSCAWAQQEIGLTFLSHLVQAPTQVNPALFTKHRVNVALPNLYAGYQNSSFQIGDLFTETAGGRKLDLDPVLASMGIGDNLIRSTASVSGGAISFQLKDKYQFSLFQNVHFDALLEYPKTLPELLWRGNGAFIGQEVAIGPKINLLGYSEYGLGLAGKVNDKLTVGINIKYLSGFLGLRTIKSDLSVYTNAEYYQLRLESDLLFQTAGLTDIFDENETDVLANDNTAYFLNSQNAGFAVDLGFSLQLNDELELQGALQDVGNINWKQYALEQASKGTFEYNGEVINPFEEDREFNFDEVADSLGRIFEFNSRSKAFVTNLPQRFYLGGFYRTKPNLRLGATMQGEFYRDVTSMSLTFHAQQQVGNILSVGAILGYHNQVGLLAGLNTTVELGPVQVFFITDNIVTLVNPDMGRGTNVRAGLNLVFFKDRKKKEEVEISEVEIGEPGN